VPTGEAVLPGMLEERANSFDETTPGMNARVDPGFLRYAEECPDAVIVTDRDGTIVYVNAACERVTGYPRAELVGRTSATLKSGLHEADFYRGLWQALLAGNEFRAVFCNRRRNGELYYEEKILRAMGEGFVSFGRDVTDRARELDKLTHAATHDSLTDLPNRRLFLDRLGQALRHAARANERLVVATFDIDRFRDVNNRWGHLAGDEVLQAVAQRTRACLRDADTVARVGGDEFGVLLVGVAPADAGRVLEKIVAANAAPVRFETEQLAVSISMGACGYPRDGAIGFELRKEADRRMYEAKRAGGNRYVL
jgi:diguanylate cyclase (GGDEF)-like protein/PAS domain S-box-containing protein